MFLMLNLLKFLKAKNNRDKSIIGSKFQGIWQEVQNYLQISSRVTQYTFEYFHVIFIVRFVLNLFNQSYSFLVCQVPTLIESIIYSFIDIEVIIIKLEGVLLDFGQIQ